MTDIEAFYALLRMAVGRSDSLGEKLDKKQWLRISTIAKQQSLIGVLLPAVDALAGRKELPLGISSMWYLTADKIRERSEATLKAARQVCGSIRSDGMRCCVLKGPGVAALYPDPSLRQSGDIDIWVEGGVDKVLGYLRTKGKIGDVFYHHCDVGKSGTIPIEIHFTPNWFNSFLKDRRLQKLFLEESSKQFDNFDEELGFPVTTPVFTAFLGLLHILRHVLFEGVGLRQVMDFYYILMGLTPAERDETARLMRSFGMEKFGAALMYVEGKAFGLEEEKMLCGTDPKRGEKLLEEMIRGGNFGRYDSRDTVKKDDPLLKRAVLRIRRLLRYSDLCPSEVLWAPVFKVWQYFWRIGRN